MTRTERITHILYPLIILGVAAALAGCSGSGVTVRPVSGMTMIHYTQLKDLDESRNLNNLVLYVDEGESIPLRLSMETDFMAFKQDHVDLVAKQRLYFMIRMPENLSAEEMSRLKEVDARTFSGMSDQDRAAFMKDFMIYISRDATTWAPLCKGTAYRQVLDFKEGRFSLGVMASTTEGLGASLDIRTVK
ncbi:MAG: hypothetical protein V1793_13890 [Pseudomonadota bacterium]